MMTLKIYALLSIAWLVAGTALCADAPAAKPSVHVIHLPDNAFVPDVAIGADGTMHMVYALGDNAWYVRSADNGATFTPPVAVNTSGQVELRMGERGPKIALGKDDAIHVVWLDRWAPGAKTQTRHARSIDGGKTFSAPTQLSTKNGMDGVTMAADPSGNVIAFWHAFDPPQKEVPEGHWIYLARSFDNGATFAPAERLQLKGIKDLACSMCLMRARIGTDGKVYLAFRSAENNIRDFYMLKCDVRENAFRAIRVNDDNWHLESCPMCGPEFTLDVKGDGYCAFMSKHKVYWSVLPAGGSAFRLHVATPTNQDQEIYPTAVSNGKGDVLLLWQVGPMAVDKKATVHWAIYSSDGTFTGRTAQLGTTTSGTKPTAFADREGGFHIVTTAKP